MTDTISQKISFYAYCPQGDVNITNYQKIPYLNFGYIKLTIIPIK